MTMPFERTLAVKKARKFMESLLNDPSTPQNIKGEALHILKHYPYDCDMDYLEENKEQHIFHNRLP